MNEQVSIEQKSEAIALFMECKFDGCYWHIPFLKMFKKELEFDKSWEWVMAAVEKIESIDNGRWGVCIDVLNTTIHDYSDANAPTIIQTDIYPDNGDTKLSITYAAVYEFIQWYQNKQQ